MKNIPVLAILLCGLLSSCSHIKGKIYYDRGVALEKERALAEAKSEFDSAIAVSPDMIEAYEHRANVKRMQLDHKGSLEDLNKALALDPKQAGNYLNRGYEKIRLKDSAGAIQDLDKTILLDPKMKLAYFDRALLKFQTSDFRGCIADFSKTIELDTVNEKTYQLYQLRATAKYKLQDYKAAIIDYNKVLELNSKDDLSYLYRGLCELRVKGKDAGCSDIAYAAKLGSEEAADSMKTCCH